MKIGVCVDPFRPLPEGALEGFDLVRVVAFDEPDAVKFVHEIIAQGVEVALVLARESMGSDNWAAKAVKYNKLYRPDYLVVGNEADAYLLGEPSPSSWSMEPAEYQLLLDSVINAVHVPQPLFVVGGLVSGQPTWLNNLNINAYDAIDVHPYGKGPDEAAALLEAYANTVYHDIHVLEFNRPLEEITAYKLAIALYASTACWFHYDYGEFALTPEIKATLVGDT